MTTSPGAPPDPDSQTRIAALTNTCIAIARREAKNFYYAFLALPRAKRDAICAVYAFMRHADDISDDESLLTRSSAAPTSPRGSMPGITPPPANPHHDPVFIALDDTRLRFNIPLDLLDQLVHGTAMDLEPRTPT